MGTQVYKGTRERHQEKEGQKQESDKQQRRQNTKNEKHSGNWGPTGR